MDTTTSNSKPPKLFTLGVRKKIEVNTDPQRRCYNGCHARSEMVWTAWADLLDYTTEAAGRDTLECFQKINPDREYVLTPYMVHPDSVESKKSD